MVLDRAEERIGEMKESSVEINQTEKKKYNNKIEHSTTNG